MEKIRLVLMVLMMTSVLACTAKIGGTTVVQEGSESSETETEEEEEVNLDGIMNRELMITGTDWPNGCLVFDSSFSAHGITAQAGNFLWQVQSTGIAAAWRLYSTTDCTGSSIMVEFAAELDDVQSSPLITVPPVFAAMSIEELSLANQPSDIYIIRFQNGENDYGAMVFRKSGSLYYAVEVEASLSWNDWSQVSGLTEVGVLMNNPTCNGLDPNTCPVQSRILDTSW